jgi:hypothetical protein
VGYLTASFFLTRTYNPVLFFLLGMGVGLVRWVESRQSTPTPLVEVSIRDIRRSVILATVSIPAIWILIRAYWALSGGA